MVVEAGAMDVSTSLTTATSLFNWVIECITANPVMTAAFVVAVLIPAGIMIFSQLKNAV